MPILSFISHCFFPDRSGKHLTLPMASEVKGSQLVPVAKHLSLPMASEVKGSQLVPVASEDPTSVGDEHEPVGSKEPSSWGESVIVTSESPSSHGQSLLAVSQVLNSQCQISEIFKYSELEKATKNFHPSRILGDGDNGIVYSGILEGGRHVAIKHMHEFRILRFHDEKLESERRRNFMNEVAILTCLRHENLVQLYGCTSPHAHELLLVEEYIPNGTVAGHLLREGTLPWSTRLNIAIQTASGLAYLHASNIIHRNMKTSNIVLDSSLNAKVADFGLSRLVPHGVTHITTGTAGTMGYMDPEYYDWLLLSDKSDVYSFGVILIQLISSLPAFNSDNKQPFLSRFAMDKILCGHLQQLVDPALEFQSDDWISETISAVAQLAFRCLQPDRDMRPPMGEVLSTLESIRGGSSQSAVT